MISMLIYEIRLVYEEPFIFFHVFFMLLYYQALLVHIAHRGDGTGQELLGFMAFLLAILFSVLCLYMAVALSCVRFAC